jgi:signal transduction histidine kinase
MSTETTSLVPEGASEDRNGGRSEDRRLHFLLVEDNPLDVELVGHELRKAGFDFTSAVVECPEDFTREINARRPDLVLADYNLPHWRGMEALEILRQAQMDVPLILVTGALGETTAVECIKSGITDYVLKGSLARLPLAIRRALLEKRLLEQRKQAEREKEEYLKELQRSNAELEQFAYVASHDLQEPLRMVASYTEILGERYRGKLDANADKYIGYAVDGAQRMQRLIRDLLAYARVSSQAKPLHPTDSAAVVASVVVVMHSVIGSSKTEIVCGQLPTVMADELQLSQVFQNLIANAIKFHADSAPLIEITATLIGATWEFSVKDNGIGMDMEQSGRIFQMFQRLHSREEYEGTGIGLAIAKRIVERHGGRIWCDSAPGQGSTFHFTMPKAVLTHRNPSVERVQLFP